MNIKNISTELQALTHSTNRSEASQMRDLIDDIESSIKAGVRQDIILKTLNFKMNLSSFRSTLKRLRKERLTSNPQQHQQPQHQQPQHQQPQKLQELPTQPKPTVANLKASLHNLDDIDPSAFE